MNNSVLEIVKARIKARVAAISDPATSLALLAAVYEEGDAVDETLITDAKPIAAILYGPERVKETTSKMMLIMPYTIEVVYHVASGTTAVRYGAYILGEIKKDLLQDANRVLPGLNPSSAAIDNRYTGGGSEIVPLNDQNPCSKWGFAAEFEVDYRHSTADPAVVT